MTSSEFAATDALASYLTPHLPCNPMFGITRGALSTDFRLLGDAPVSHENHGGAGEIEIYRWHGSRPDMTTAYPNGKPDWECSISGKAQVS